MVPRFIVIDFAGVSGDESGMCDNITLVELSAMSSFFVIAEDKLVVLDKAVRVVVVFDDVAQLENQERPGAGLSKGEEEGEPTFDKWEPIET